MTAIQRILYAVDDNPCVIEEAQAMVQEDCDRRRGCGGDVGCGSSSFRKSLVSLDEELVSHHGRRSSCGGDFLFQSSPVQHVVR